MIDKNWKEESIKTRIETIIYHRWMRFNFVIEKKNPLKQGLKQPGKDGSGHALEIEKKNPLKQGLKLGDAAQLPSVQPDWKEESIKTRIETHVNCSQRNNRIMIEKKNPLKQGLKLLAELAAHSESFIEKKNPLKQGLKHKDSAITLGFNHNWKEESIKTRIETWNKARQRRRKRKLKRRIH